MCAKPASSDKSTNALSQAFIIGHAVFVQENEVRVSGSVCLSKHFALVVRTGGRIVTRNEPFYATEQWKDDGINLRRNNSKCQVPRSTAQDLTKINLLRLQTKSMDGSGLNFIDRYQTLVDMCRCGYQ